MLEPEPRPQHMTAEQLEALPEASAFIKTGTVEPDGITRYKLHATRGFVHQSRPDDLVCWTDAAGVQWAPALIELDGVIVWAKRYFSL